MAAGKGLESTKARRKKRQPHRLVRLSFWQREKDSYGLTPPHALCLPKIHRVNARILGASWVEPRPLTAAPLPNKKDARWASFLFGSGRRIRTLTYGVRVRCATITQSRCVPDEQTLLYRFGWICQHLFSGNSKKISGSSVPARGTELPYAAGKRLSSPPAGLRLRNISSAAFSAAKSARCR